MGVALFGQLPFKIRAEVLVAVSKFETTCSPWTPVSQIASHDLALAWEWWCSRSAASHVAKVKVDWAQKPRGDCVSPGGRSGLKYRPGHYPLRAAPIIFYVFSS